MHNHGCDQWFYSEPGQHNPYKTVYTVIKFAKNHKHPLQRSAFTHCDNYIPSQFDSAKERYGGPFTTEQVATFLRILFILFAVGPVFALEVPASFYIFPLFGLHTLQYYWFNGRDKCNSEYIWKTTVASGSMMSITTTVILFPVYI